MIAARLASALPESSRFAFRRGKRAAAENRSCASARRLLEHASVFQTFNDTLVRVAEFFPDDDGRGGELFGNILGFIAYIGKPLFELVPFVFAIFPFLFDFHAGEMHTHVQFIALLFESFGQVIEFML
jgi:hypothetical protein